DFSRSRFRPGTEALAQRSEPSREVLERRRRRDAIDVVDVPVLDAARPGGEGGAEHRAVLAVAHRDDESRGLEVGELELLGRAAGRPELDPSLCQAVQRVDRDWADVVRARRVKATRRRPPPRGTDALQM